MNGEGTGADVGGSRFHRGGGLIDRFAVVALLPVTAVVTWWLVGDLSYTGPSSLGPGRDYLVQPLNISSGAEQVIGSVAVAVIVGSCAVLLRPRSWPRRDPRLLAVLLPLLLAGVVLGWGWRVLTAGVVGANIGGGLVVFFGSPLVIAALGWSWIYGRRLASRDGRPN